MLSEPPTNMKVCSSLDEEQWFPCERTPAFTSSPDPVVHHTSHTPAELSRPSSPTSGQTSSSSPTSGQTSSQVKSNIKVVWSFSQTLPDINYADQRFSDETESDHTERKHSPLLLWTNNSLTPSFRASPESTTDVLHREDQSHGSPNMRDLAQTCDQEDKQSTHIPAIRSENAPVKSRRHLCCWKACGQKFSSQIELSAHVNQDHVRFECPELDFKCHWQGCLREGKGFNARYKMLIHIRTHTNEKPHTCVVCGKSFSRLENLKIHTRSHTGERPYSCTFPGCSKAYSNSSDRFKHIRTHQEQKPYKCKVPGCRKQYTDPSSLRKHVRTHRHTPDCSRMELRHSLRANTYTSGLKMEVCSPSGDIAHYQEDLSFCELHKYINTVRHNIEHPNLINENFQTIQALQRANDVCFTNTGKDVCQDDLSDMEKKYRSGYRDVLQAVKLISQHQNVNSGAEMQESLCFCSDKRDHNKNYIKCEPNSPNQSTVSAPIDTSDELSGGKEDKMEKNTDLRFADGHLGNRNEQFQSKFCNTDSVSVLPAVDLSNNHSLVSYNHENNDCHQEAKTASCSPPPVVPGDCCSKSPKLEHWKKRKLLISEQEMQASLQASPAPTSNISQQSPAVPVSQNPMPDKETPLKCSIPSNLSIATSISPLINNPSSLPHAHISHCPTLTSSSATPTPTSELSPSLQLLSCPTVTPSLYLLHTNNSPLYPLVSNSYSSIPNNTLTIAPPTFYTHNLSLSENPLLPIPNPCHYNIDVDRYFAMNPTYLLPSGPAFSPTDFDWQSSAVKQTWQHHGVNNLPGLVTLDNGTLLSPGQFHHFVNRLRLAYRDLPLDLPSLYQAHAFRYPLY